MKRPLGHAQPSDRVPTWTQTGRPVLSGTSSSGRPARALAAPAQGNRSSASKASPRTDQEPIFVATSEHRTPHRPREPPGVLPGDAMMMLARLESADAPLVLPKVVTFAATSPRRSLDPAEARLTKSQP